jgi:WD40 repeat protein
VAPALIDEPVTALLVLSAQSALVFSADGHTNRIDVSPPFPWSFSSQPLLSHSRPVLAAARPEDGPSAVFATACADSTVRLFASPEAKPVELRSHSLSCNCVAFLPGSAGSRLASASRDGTVVFWDAERHCPTGKYTADRNVATSLAAMGPNVIAQGAEDLCVRIWDARTPSTPVAVIATGPYFPTALCFLHLPGLLAAGTKGICGVGGDVQLWDTRYSSHPPLAELPSLHAHTVSALLPLGSTHLLSAGHDGATHVLRHDISGSQPNNVLHTENSCNVSFPVTAAAVLDPNPGSQATVLLGGGLGSLATLQCGADYSYLTAVASDQPTWAS